MSNEGDERGSGTEPPEWWDALLARAHARRKEENDVARAEGRVEPHVEGLVALGEALAKAVGRKTRWNHSVVSNFLRARTDKRRRCTREMAIAFSQLYGIPVFECVVRAETLDRALELRAFLAGWNRASNPETPERVEKMDKAAHALFKQQKDQRVQVPSGNEASTRRGSRRASRRS